MLQLYGEDGSGKGSGTVAQRCARNTLFMTLQLIDNLGFQFQISSFSRERPLSPQQNPHHQAIWAILTSLVGDNEYNDLCSEISGLGYLHWN